LADEQARQCRQCRNPNHITWRRIKKKKRVPRVESSCNGKCENDEGELKEWRDSKENLRVWDGEIISLVVGIACDAHGGGYGARAGTLPARLSLLTYSGAKDG